MAMSDRKITRGTVHRTNITTSDTTADISSAIGVQYIVDNLHVACTLECSAASTTGNVSLALFDDNGNFIGITEAQTFTANATWRNGAAGDYVAPTLLFDVMGSAKIKALVSGLSGGNITNLWLLPLTLG
jgi:hypothetical protein